MMLLITLLACEPAPYLAETHLTVDVDGTTEVDIAALMETHRATVSAFAVVRVTSTPSTSIDASEGFLALSPSVPTNRDEEERLAGTFWEGTTSRIDGVLETTLSTRPICNDAGECWSGYCINGEDCVLPFTLQIEPREQAFTTDLHVQWRQVMSDLPMDCGLCDVSLTATVVP